MCQPVPGRARAPGTRRRGNISLRITSTPSRNRVISPLSAYADLSADEILFTTGTLANMADFYHRYPDYADTSVLDELRVSDYSYLEETGHVYADGICPASKRVGPPIREA